MTEQDRQKLSLGLEGLAQEAVESWDKGHYTSVTDTLIMMGRKSPARALAIAIRMGIHMKAQHAAELVILLENRA